MTTKKRKRKWLSPVLAFVMVLGLVSASVITAKAEVISEVAVTIDLPEAEETISACGTPTVTSSNYTVEVYKWLEGSYETAADVSAAISDGSNILADTDTLEEKKSYTVLFQAITYGAAGNDFQGEGMSLAVNGENALFVTKKSTALENQMKIVIFAYTFTVPETIEYNLKIGGVAVKSNNLVIDKKDTSKITSGSLTFDPSTYTLTMDNVVASGNFGDYFLQYSGEDDLTIQVVGTNTVTFTAAGWQGIRSDGKGNMRITSESNGELLIQGTTLKTGIYFYNNLVLDGSLKLTCKISCYDSATGLKSDSGGTLTVEDGVKLFVYTDVDESAASPVSQGIYAKVVMNGGEVNIESSGAVSNGVFGIGPYTQINGGVLTVACEYRAVYGSIAFDYPGAYAKVTASTNYDGSNPVTYNSSNNSSYKYIKVEKGNPKTAIDSLTIDTLYKPVAGEMPACPTFLEKADSIYYDWNWCVWNTEAGTWDSFYDEEGENSVGDSVFQEGKKYALKLFVYPKSAYTFPSTMTIKHNEVNIPNYDELNPNVTYKKISSSGSSLELFITEDNMPVNTKTPVNSAKITINGYHHGKNAEDITVALDAAGADFNKDEETLPNGWYLAIDNDCDGEMEGLATGALKVDADYYLAVGMKAEEGYRVSSITKEKITLSDGTASVGEIMMCNASVDKAEIVYKLPKLNYNITSVPVQPATMEADGIKEHYACEYCGKCFEDAEGTTEVTDEDLCIPKVVSVSFTQSEYDYTVEFLKKGWEKHVVVTDEKGNQLKYFTDYKVEQIGYNLFGVTKAKVTGKGNYSFKKEASCTVHPSSTLRFTADINKLNHGSYSINLYNDTKTCIITGDERLMSYISMSGLAEMDKAIDLKSDEIFDLDQDGSEDIELVMDTTSLCEGGSSITIQVLPTCSIKENKTFTLSETAQNYFKNLMSVPYYEKITFRFVDSCASGHSYGSEWKSDATGHWKICSVCSNKNVEKHVPGPEATATTPQTCTVCGYVIAPAKGDTGNTEVKIPEKGTTIEDSDNKAVYKVTGADKANPTVEYTAPVSKTAKTVTIPATIAKDGITYKVTSVAKNAFKNNRKITTVTVGSNVKTIGANAFYGCTSLKTVVIGSRVTTIGTGAFSGCKKLSKVTLGKNVTTIGDKAFYKCTALTKITIPSKVSKIGKYAFYGCKKLKTITIKTTKLTDKKVGSKAFKGIHSKATIKVPKTKVKAYKAMLKKKGIGKGVKVKK